MNLDAQLADTIPPSPPAMPAPPARVCGCGRSYDAFVWLQLPRLGVMHDGDGGLLELRNCPCGSTLASEVES